MEVDKLVFITFKNCYSAKDTVERMKRQAIDWDKIFANYVIDKGLLSRI